MANVLYLADLKGDGKQGSEYVYALYRGIEEARLLEIGAARAALLRLYERVPLPPKQPSEELLREIVDQRTILHSGVFRGVYEMHYNNLLLERSSLRPTELIENNKAGLQHCVKIRTPTLEEICRINNWPL